MFSNSSSYFSVNVFSFIASKMFLFLVISSVVVVMVIKKVNFIIGIFHKVDVIVWVFKADQFHFSFMMSKYSFGMGLV